MKRILITLFMAGAIASCEVVDQEPISEITGSNFWITASDAEAGLIGCYDSFQDAIQDRYIAWGDARSDMYGADFATGFYANLIENDLNADVVSTQWDLLYRTISYCNLVVTNVPGINDATLSSTRRGQIIGEAKFLRALSYFYAVRLWGDVPLITEPYTSAEDNLDVERVSTAMVYEQIEQDITGAIDSLPTNYGGNPVFNRGRATVGGAKALQTDVSLWRGNYEQAAAAALDIMNNSLYALEPQGEYEDIFREENTAESIFEIQFSLSNQEFNQNAELFLQLPLISRGQPVLVPSDKLLNSFEPGDLRRPVILDESTSRPFIIKYLGTENPGGFVFPDDNMIIYRLADVILMRAEALNELDQRAEAVDLLNQIRNRAGLSPLTEMSQADLRQAILDERFIEFSAEGKRWFDLVRTGTAIETLNNITDPANLLWPIFGQELIFNPNIEQNAFYQ